MPSHLMRSVRSQAQSVVCRVPWKTEMFKLSRLLRVTIFLLGLLGCAPAPVAPTGAPTLAPFSTPTSAGAAVQFDSVRALEHNRMLAVTLGARVAGSENAARAGDYIAQQFVSYGYTIEKQAFTFEGWEDRGTRVEIIAPEPRALDARPIQYSPAGSVEAELLAVGGIGDESDFAKVDVRGKIALVQRGTLPFSDKAKHAAKAGATAIVIYNNAPGDFSGALRERVSIPTIGLSGRDGQAFLDWLSKGAVKVKLTSDTVTALKTGRNIIAAKRGASDSVIVLGAHYDSVEVGQGANDNGSGTAVLLELARVLAQKSYKHTLVFIAFDAEEEGLIGSRHYVTSLPDDVRRKIVAMLNFDMLGGGTGPLLLDGEGRVGKLVLDAAKELGIQARGFQLGSGAGSDHASFRSVGIDAVFFSRDYNLLHTPQDVIGEVREEYLAEAGRVAVRVVEELEGK